MNVEQLAIDLNQQPATARGRCPFCHKTVTIEPIGPRLWRCQTCRAGLTERT